ncbi:hypothetical protein [uncultured Roseovarius sp.]|uniref:hypothetical protein n=1 Tax=uncultured Roseovarius sp. TaxID=293344 RepID=UPI00261A4596|nr:hypothetical protein [uncultured Roseovarius sp.]
MTTPEQPRRETLTQVQRMLSCARPDQLRRLLADIQSVEMITDRGESTPQRRAS